MSHCRRRRFLSPCQLQPVSILMENLIVHSQLLMLVLTCLTSQVLMRLDDVVVTTLGQKDTMISCVLNFTIFERLISDCVLGADFFTQ